MHICKAWKTDFIFIIWEGTTNLLDRPIHIIDKYYYRFDAYFFDFIIYFYNCMKYYIEDWIKVDFVGQYYDLVGQIF